MAPKNKLISSVEDLHNKINDYLEIIKNKIKNCRQFGKENWNIVEKNCKAIINEIDLHKQVIKEHDSDNSKTYANIHSRNQLWAKGGPGPPRDF